MVYRGLLVCVIFLSFSQLLSGQEQFKQSTFPTGLSFEYGLGSYAVTDEYISDEKYSGSLPYYSLLWSSDHDTYIYNIRVDFRSSSDIANNNVTADLYQFSLNQSFIYVLPSFTIFDKEALLYLGPSSEMFFYFKEQNIAVSGFDYAQSFAVLISGSVSSQLFYKMQDNLDIETSLDFSLISLGFRMVDEEEDDETPAKLLSLFSGTNINFRVGPRYYFADNFSVKAAYHLNLTRIDSWEPLLSAGDNAVLSLTYGF
jgi:hypothetical protein